MTMVDKDIPAVTGIYKVTCNINLKSYVGQARNIKARIKQHLQSSVNPAAKDYEVPFHAAIRKYGVENFDVTVLEVCTCSELNDREQHWIKALGTYIHSDKSIGYNATEGGKQSVRMLKLTPDVLDQVYKLLNENVLTYNEIAAKFDLNPSTIRKINVGKICYNFNFTYPLRDNSLCENKQKFGCYLYTGTAVEQLDIHTNTLLNLYPSALAASIALGDITYNKHIAHCCSGNRKTAYGYKWKFRDISEQDWKALF